MENCKLLNSGWVQEVGANLVIACAKWKFGQLRGADPGEGSG